jgi:two-component system OmpR family sensor kinase
MVRLHSLRVKLSVIGCLLFGLNAAFGLLTIHLFSSFNELSADLRERWLPSTRLLGDLNNFTSDYRAAEGDSLLASGPAERAVRQRVIEELDRSVAHAQRDYERISHTGAEFGLYATFSTRWHDYQANAARVLALATAGTQDQAVALYGSESRATYDAASDALGVLTDRNVEEAQQASDRTARAYVQARWLIVSALLFAVMMLAAALDYVRRSISIPLINLARSMRQLAANNTDINIGGVTRRDEIGEMAQAVTVFRANAIDLIQSQQGLAQQAAMLEEKLEHEQHLARLQRNFVSMISHEFRTPLTIIDAHAQRLINRKDQLGAGDIADRAGRMRTAVQRITALMDNLLNSSMLIDGETKLFFHPTEIDLAALLRDVCAFHRETAPSAFIGEGYSSAPLPIIGDPKLLFQAFSNLLSNAIKYSTHNIVVHVHIYQNESGTNISIRDRGVGIPEHNMEHLFTRYYRGSNVTGIVGTGVGLYLVKTVVDLHEGHIRVESNGSDGTCFTVVLPGVPRLGGA